MKFIAGFILGLVVVPLVVYLYFISGAAPVAASAQPMPFEKMLARKALHARLEKEMPKSAPVNADEANLEAGARIYRENCAVCHGLPGQPETAISRGMFPRPPALLEGKGVTDDSPEETYWKVANGIRMTGMPGFDQRLTSTQMWQVSQLAANANKLSTAVRALLQAPMPPPNPPASTANAAGQ
ncbi:MAG TPA: cytochrome c [Terriglobales bacterium]|nr:cytochrome c [Terriglobales bacterium]